MSFVKFPSIEQFRHTIADIQHNTQFIGLNENNKPKYDETIELPTMKFVGSVKLHGTNAAVVMKNGEMHSQSRSRVLSSQKDNQGFNRFVFAREEAFRALFADLKLADDETVAIFGEWCGQGIQRGVAISNLPKRFVVFAVLRKTKSDDSEDGDVDDAGIKQVPKNEHWLTPSEMAAVKNPEKDIFNVHDYDTFEMEIDFNKPDEYIEKLEQITQKIETRCPISAAMGSAGTGEGVVWTCNSEKLGTIRFKVKGEEHRVTKSKKGASVAPEKLENLKKFTDYAVTQNRLDQAIEQVFTANDIKPHIRKTGLFVKWIQNDILKEEQDTIKANGLTGSEATKECGKVAREWFLKQWNMGLFK